VSDERLKNDVLARADEDAGLSEQARLVVLAALESSEDLSEVLGGGTTRRELVESLTAPIEEPSEPTGAYLTEVTVEGFRGIGPKVTLPLKPGPGLTVVAGRNGSGKSTLAEGLELALTGTNSRWKNKPVIWSQDWRNLHAGKKSEIRVGLAEEGAGTTMIGVDWPPGDHVAVDDSKRWVQRKGKKQEDISVLGWDSALEMYRPLMSYDELSGILEGSPSAFYDQLYKLLGLEQLTDAMARLDAEVKQLRQPAAELRKARDALKPTLESHEDPRAATALAQVRKTKPNLDVVRPLITDGTHAAVPQAWLRAERLTTPDPDDMALKCAALRSAADSQRQETERSDALAADRAELLEMGLDFHEHFGDQKCPVCGHGTLDANWAVAARAALEQEQQAAQALTAARAATAQARSAVMAAVREIPAPPTEDPDLTNLDAARATYDALVKLPADGDIALAGHVTETLEPLRQAYANLRQEAVTLIQSRSDAWHPVALELAGWISKAEKVAEAEPRLAVADEALKWLQKNAGVLRNERIAPLADQAKGIWAALRQESNVDLGEIRLEGQKTTRRVVLKADVDGSDTDAFGVMSQGELQALSLAIFIPRATSPASPFRFLVLDDPIQAMDPSKIDGFLQVLTRLAENRQVIVFTHDDRLPSAIRMSRSPARIVELVRGANSVVTVTESTRPADRLLEDAFAIAIDEAVPDDIKKKAVPLLCREALEVTAWDVFSSRQFTAGNSRTELEDIWNDATTTRQRVALAVDPTNNAEIDKWLAGGSARRATMAVATKGAHAGVKDYLEAVKQARLAVEDLGRLAS
jgi:DNA repair exonuclease SbcCD ATPase subunit